MSEEKREVVLVNTAAGMFMGILHYQGDKFLSIKRTVAYDGAVYSPVPIPADKLDLDSVGNILTMIALDTCFLISMVPADAEHELIRGYRKFWSLGEFEGQEEDEAAEEDSKTEG